VTFGTCQAGKGDFTKETTGPHRRFHRNVPELAAVRPDIEHAINAVQITGRVPFHPAPAKCSVGDLSFRRRRPL
jgi:hypothetical protein